MPFAEPSRVAGLNPDKGLWPYAEDTKQNRKDKVRTVFAALTLWRVFLLND
jgi:hypothetical protein